MAGFDVKYVYEVRLMGFAGVFEKAAPFTTAKRPQLNVLQAGRGLAAVAVVLHHADLAAVAFHASSRPAGLSSIFGYGYFGVDFFFVLSGFIIFYATEQRGAGSIGLQKFLLQRAVRIYIPYLPLGIGIALAYSVLPEISASGRSFGWFTTITLLPSELPPALSVAWTLRHEIVFYLIFGIAYFSGWLLPGLAIWCCLILASAAANATATYAFAQPIVGLVNLEFFFGLAAAWLVLNNYTIPSAWLGVGLFVSWMAWSLLSPDRQGSPLIAAGLVFVILFAVQLEHRNRLKVPRLLVFLGDASYSIYLFHNIVISILIRFCNKLGFLEKYTASMVVLTCGSLLVGTLFHLAFERPVLRFVRRLRSGPPHSHTLSKLAAERVRQA